jgi:hypothetical protein
MILALEVISVVTRISRFECSSLRRCYANNESLCPNLGQRKKEEEATDFAQGLSICALSRDYAGMGLQHQCSPLDSTEVIVH